MQDARQRRGLSTLAIRDITGEDSRMHPVPLSTLRLWACESVEAGSRRPCDCAR